MRYLFLLVLVVVGCGGEVETPPGEIATPQNPRCMTFHNTWSCADEPFDVQTDAGARPCTEGCELGQACVLRRDPTRDGICR